MTDIGSGAGGSTTTMDKASDAADTAKQEAGKVADRAKNEAGAVVDEAKAQGQQLARQARSQLQQQVDDGATKVAGTLREVGSELDTMAGAARDSNDLAATAVREIGSRVATLAEHLEQGGVQTVAADVRRFAARRPGVFLAGALAAGVVVGRLVRNTDLGEVKDAITSGTDEPDTTAAPNGVATSPAPAPAPASAAPAPPSATGQVGP